MAVTREWWCGERARHAIIGRVAVEAPVYRMTVTDPGWESLTTQDQDFWVRQINKSCRFTLYLFGLIGESYGNKILFSVEKQTDSTLIMYFSMQALM